MEKKAIARVWRHLGYGGSPPADYRISITQDGVWSESKRYEIVAPDGRVMRIGYTITKHTIEAARREAVEALLILTSRVAA